MLFQLLQKTTWEGNEADIMSDLINVEKKRKREDAEQKGDTSGAGAEGGRGRRETKEGT